MTLAPAPLAAPARRRLRPFVAVEASTVLSGTANGITTVVLPWLVLERTGSPAAAGLVAALTALPIVLSSLVAGTIVDRAGRRRSAVASDVLSLAAVAAIPVMDGLGRLDLTAIAVLAVLGAAFDPAGFTAREAMLPASARAARLSLERVNGLHEASWGVSAVLGPGIAGVLIGAMGSVATLWATAAAFALSAVALALVRVPGGGRPLTDGARTSFWADTREGLAFVRNDRVLLSAAAVTSLLVATYLPIEAVLLPVYFHGQDDPGRLGWLVMTMSLGWVAGSLLYSGLGHRLPKRATFVLAVLGTALALTPLALLPPYPVMLAAGAVSGLLFGPVNPLLNLTMQHRTPERLRGRVVGVVTSLGYAAGPAGYLLAGPLVQAVGLQAAFAVMVAAVLAAAVTTLFLRPLRALDALSPMDGDGAPDGPATPLAVPPHHRVEA